MDRPTAIADAGVTLIATRGIRALTHHAIDDQLGLARGSTSYYARTRRDLIALIVRRLAEQRNEDLGGFTLPDPVTPDVAAELIAAAIERVAQRPNEYLARMALLIELPHDDDLRAGLTTSVPIRLAAQDAAGRILAQWGVPDPAARAADLIGLMDGLMAQVIIRRAPIDTAMILRAYLVGLQA